MLRLWSGNRSALDLRSGNRSALLLRSGNRSVLDLSLIHIYQRIIQGILNQDLNSAARAIEEHLQGSLENYTQILNNNQWMKIMSELKNMNP